MVPSALLILIFVALIIHLQLERRFGEWDLLRNNLPQHIKKFCSLRELGLFGFKLLPEFICTLSNLNKVNILCLSLTYG